MIKIIKEEKENNNYQEASVGNCNDCERVKREKKELVALKEDIFYFSTLLFKKIQIKYFKDQNQKQNCKNKKNKN